MPGDDARFGKTNSYNNVDYMGNTYNIVDLNG
jgi:hypothetical protein